MVAERRPRRAELVNLHPNPFLLAALISLSAVALILLQQQQQQQQTTIGMSNPSSPAAAAPVAPVAPASKTAIPSLPISVTTQLQAPPSPRTHRALRRLQSAHTLGARARDQQQPSLISQQRLRENQRNPSPTRSSPVPGATPAPINRSPQRGRANSDATPPLIHQMNLVTASKRAGNKKPVFSHGHLSLQQIIREGPTDGDFIGALESARWKVIDEGVKSAEDGMVS